MCDCPKDKINQLVSPKNEAANETSPQTQCEGPSERRPKQGCCRRVLTYEDEANVTVTELPVSIEPPPGIAGIAIVRRRIDFASPDRKDEASKKPDESATSDDMPDEQQLKDSEKEGDGESPDETQKEANKTDQQPTENVVTSTPCPGKMNPNNECNCSPIPKT